MSDKTLNISSLVDKANFTKSDLTYLLNLEDEPSKNLLFRKAKQLENAHLNSPINSYGLIEISTYCSENCNYCRLRKDNKSIIRERMNREQIIEIAKEINKSGIESIVIRSGYDDFYDVDRISYIIYSIKKYTDVEIMLSLGERTLEEYKEWKIAGASGYRLRFKSSNPIRYKSLKTYGTLESRLEHIDYLKSIGFQICSGSIIGLPDQTSEDIAEDILLCKKLNLDIAEFLPFNSQENTPFKNLNSCSDKKVQKIVSVAKLVLNNSIRCAQPRIVFNLENEISLS